MGKRGLHIEKDEIYKLIKKFTGDNKQPEQYSPLNQEKNSYKCTIKKDDKLFYINIYYKSNKTVTIQPIGNEESKTVGQELKCYIENNMKYKDNTSVSETFKMDKDKFDLLIKYLSELEGINLSYEQDRGVNGHQFKFEYSSIGDKISLTYYKSNKNVLFQGYKMKLYTEIKCFINALGISFKPKNNTSGLESSHLDDNDEILEKINNIMEKSYTNLSKLEQSLIYDSMTQVIRKYEYIDYSVWTFPVLKALESRIKQIFKNEGIIIKDQGFKITCKRGTEKTTYPIFSKDNKDDTFYVNTGIVKIKNGNTLGELSKCYTYYNKNRHTLFHTKQQTIATRTIDTQEEAERIVYEVCKLIDSSYKNLGK